MDKTDQLITRTEQLVKQIEGLQDVIQKLSAELQQHSEELQQQMGKTKKKAAAGHVLRPLMSPERRTAPRRKGNPVSVQISNGGKGDDSLQGWVVDRSMGGIRLLVDEAVAPGTILNVRPNKVHTNFPWVQIKVRSCYPERKSWNLGCQFVEKITWEDLQQFG